MSRTILGPLTTTFTLPTACTVAVQDGEQPQLAFLAQGCSGASPLDTATCWPPVTIEPPLAPFEGLGAYSPGLVCPSDHIIACSTVYSSGADQKLFQFTLQAGETAAGCCPQLVCPSMAMTAILMGTSKRLPLFKIFRCPNLRLNCHIYVLGHRPVRRQWRSECYRQSFASFYPLHNDTTIRIHDRGVEPHSRSTHVPDAVASFGYQHLNKHIEPSDKHISPRY